MQHHQVNTFNKYGCVVKSAEQSCPDLNVPFLHTALCEPRSQQKACPCRDVADLLEEQIELYRTTKQSILQDLPEQAFQQMTPQARERALQQEMKSAGTLHPALYPPDKGQFTGHFKVSVAMPEHE